MHIILKRKYILYTLYIPNAISYLNKTFTNPIWKRYYSSCTNNLLQIILKKYSANLSIKCISWNDLLFSFCIIYAFFLKFSSLQTFIIYWVCEAHFFVPAKRNPRNRHQEQYQLNIVMQVSHHRLWKFIQVRQPFGQVSRWNNGQ